MRDSIMTEQYFKEFLAEEEARIQRFEIKLSNGEIRTDRIFSVERRISSLKFSVFIAKYSLGTDLNILKPDFEELLDNFPRFWTQSSSYINLLWMMAIAVMFDTASDPFSKLTALLDQYDRHDALLDFFSGFTLYGSTSLTNRKFLCPKPFAELGAVIESSSQDRAKLLKEYVEKKWYPGHRQFGICDAHKAKEKIYSGYWSFESGALAKILRIDDSSLKDVQYYPYDLAHFSTQTKSHIS